MVKAYYLLLQTCTAGNVHAVLVCDFNTPQRTLQKVVVIVVMIEEINECTKCFAAVGYNRLRLTS